MSTIDQLQKIRKEKLEALIKSGINPYPARCQRDQEIKKARLMEGEKVAVAGRIISLRGHGKIIFADIRDESGKIQVVFKKDQLEEKIFQLLNYLDVGDFIAVQGAVGKTQAGEISVFANNFQIISKAIRPLPDKWYGFKDVEERYRKKYLDLLMNEEVFKIFKVRSQVVSCFREFLNKRGYFEVETPVLQPIYGGGLARPFKTYHNALGIPLYLRISTELYLKRLVIGGFEKVYEIARLFRNEGIDKNHNPEFTMLETMEAYIDYEENMKLVEEMTEYTVQKIFQTTKVKYGENTVDFKTPWKRVMMAQIVKEETGFDYDAFKSIVEAKKAAEKLGVVLEKSQRESIGVVLAAVFSQLVEEKIIQPTIVYKFPVETSPLAKRCEDDPRFVERFEHFIMGMECSNNYSELNDPQELKKRLIDERKKERLGDEEAHQMDHDFVEALEYGMPPTSGIGPGIDRLVMILTNTHHLREVILFPTMRPKEEEKKEKIKPDTAIKTSAINMNKNYSQGEITIIDKVVKDKWPNFQVGVVLIEGVKVKKADPELERLKEEVINKFKDLQIADIDKFETIAAYRKTFKEFGVDWHSKRPSPDALFRRIAQGKGLYTVNTLVDAYNLAVLETKVGLAALDADQVLPPVVLRFAEGGERIVLLGEEKETEIEKGELIYTDRKRVITLDLNYRDCDQTKITLETKNILLFADGCEGISHPDLEAGLDKGIELITRFCGGVVKKKLIIR